jgi:hypothetical protein
VSLLGANVLSEMAGSSICVLCCLFYLKIFRSFEAREGFMGSSTFLLKESRRN